MTCHAKEGIGCFHIGNDLKVGRQYKYNPKHLIFIGAWKFYLQTVNKFYNSLDNICQGYIGCYIVLYPEVCIVLWVVYLRD